MSQELRILKKKLKDSKEVAKDSLLQVSADDSVNIAYIQGQAENMDSVIEFIDELLAKDGDLDEWTILEEE